MIPQKLFGFTKNIIFMLMVQSQASISLSNLQKMLYFLILISNMENLKLNHFSCFN
jgi:hypothetical protein